MIFGVGRQRFLYYIPGLKKTARQVAKFASGPPPWFVGG